MNFQPTKALSKCLKSMGISERIYEDRNRPTSALPDAFIEIMQNGAIRTQASLAGITECVLLVTINVKLLSSGSANTAKEDSIVAKMESILSRQPFSDGVYHFRLSPNMISRGRNISANYSSVLMNVNCTIY